MVTVIDESNRVRVPGWVTSMDGFRRWHDSDDFPETANVWWLRGEVWLDMSKEQIFSHVLVKTELTAVLRTLARQEQLGLYLTDGVLLSNFAAEISGKPDGLFISNETLLGERVRLIEGKEGGFTELQGSPDLVLEILSTSSEQKDNVVLMRSYWEAGIREYWLIDARGSSPAFDVFKHAARGYSRTRKQDGWVKSAVLGRSFRLTVRAGLRGHPDYLLEAR
jgi:Uma2 family endonuclease